MPKKSYGKMKATCRVTFELPPEVKADSAALCGDFNGWSRDEHLMARRKDGRFSLTMSLSADRSYRYRFLLDGTRWENDWAADQYVGNMYGTEDSLIQL